MKYYIFNTLLILTIWKYQSSYMAPCDKQYIKYLTLYSCTYPKRTISFLRILRWPQDEVDKRFEMILGKSSAQIFENMAQNNWTTIESIYKINKTEIELLKTMLFPNDRINRQKRKAQSGGYSHLGQIASQFDYWQREHDASPFKANELMKLMWTCCTTDIPCYVSNFSRIC